MITKLSISNFKSIQQLHIDCKKVGSSIGTDEHELGIGSRIMLVALESGCS